MKVVDWAEAVARWIAAGRPTRSEAEVQAIFRTFCAFATSTINDTGRADNAGAG